MLKHTDFKSRNMEFYDLKYNVTQSVINYIFHRILLGNRWLNFIYMYNVHNITSYTVYSYVYIYIYIERERERFVKFKLKLGQVMIRLPSVFSGYIIKNMIS